MGHPADQESIGELFARLADDARTMAHAELALFRTDFYRRLSRAKIGILLCLIGAIMGQAAAVTLLVTLSFVLTPWIGRLGGSAVAVAVGIGMAVVMIRIGVSRLTLVVDDDPDDDDDERKARPADAMSIEMMFDRVRRRSKAAREQLAATVGEAQARLHPQALIADLADEVIDHAQAAVHHIVNAARRRPYRLGAAALFALLLVFRPPIGRIARGLRRATRNEATSLKRKRASRPPLPSEEKTS